MNILFNGSAIPDPAALATDWVTVAVENRVYRQLVLRYEYLTAAQAAAVLGPASAATVAVSWLYPATNANISLTMKLYAASAAVLQDAAGAVSYSPLTLTLREVLP